ncbi:MAG: tetratricopeptide repeat protein [Betaproteobacteria bacterium]|nr:tetratricopeptide repeat protein [Betaproteobacteria bacterium]
MPDNVSELLQQAAHARQEGRLADAHRLLTDAIAMLRDTDRRADLARTLAAYGQIERNLGHDEPAVRAYVEAVELCRTTDDSDVLAHTLRHLGDVHLDAKRFEQAGPCYDESLALYRSRPQTRPLDLANAIRSMAILKSEHGARDVAVQLWCEARFLYETVGIGAGVSECGRRLAGLKD